MKYPRFFIGERVSRYRRLRPRTVVRISQNQDTFWYRLLGPGGQEETCWEQELRRG
ncbi:MAG: hypothetical protein IH614_08060 [Desulfuromonadales bacterium]|nr:hypothetical protein [Desulfuromonadales bacterium]